MSIWDRDKLITVCPLNLRYRKISLCSVYFWLSSIHITFVYCLSLIKCLGRSQNENHYDFNISSFWVVFFVGGWAWVVEDILFRHVVLKKTALDKTDLQKGYRTFIFINVTVTWFPWPLFSSQWAQLSWKVEQTPWFIKCLLTV